MTRPRPTLSGAGTRSRQRRSLSAARPNRMEARRSARRPRRLYGGSGYNPTTPIRCSCGDRSMAFSGRMMRPWRTSTRRSCAIRSTRPPTARSGPLSTPLGENTRLRWRTTPSSCKSIRRTWRLNGREQIAQAIRDREKRKDAAATTIVRRLDKETQEMPADADMELKPEAEEDIELIPDEPAPTPPEEPAVAKAETPPPANEETKEGERPQGPIEARAAKMRRDAEMQERAARWALMRSASTTRIKRSRKRSERRTRRPGRAAATAAASE